jgi:hypothetical protein
MVGRFIRSGHPGATALVAAPVPATTGIHVAFTSTTRHLTDSTFLPPAGFRPKIRITLKSACA